MFDAIAWRYDLLNRLLSLGIDRSWRRRLVRELARSGALRILDVATGTADLAIMAARGIPGARISGVDLSEGMLAIGRQKVERAGLSDRISLSVGDAEALEWADGTFDAVTVAFGVRNFESLEKGIAQIARVLRPGGSLFVLEFGRPRNRLFGALYRFYFHRILPVLGGLLSKDRSAYTYLPRSVDEFPYGERFARIVTESGFSDCEVRDLMTGVAQIYRASKR